MMDAQRITQALRGRWNGHSGQAHCPAHNDREPSLSISTGKNGHVLLYCFAGCDFKQIANAIEALGIKQGEGRDMCPPPLTPLSNQDDARRSQIAQRLWQESRSINDTLAEHYLRKRGITCPLSPNLRFHPACWHGASHSTHPALIAKIEGQASFAVHRTYLTCDGQKAALTPNKAMLGRSMAGAVRLREGEGALVVAEGIETALSLTSGLFDGDYALWAALSASGLASLTLPTKAQRLIIASDGDKTGRSAAERLAERAYALGWAVSLSPAPEGQDWNDILLQAKGLRYA